MRGNDSFAVLNGARFDTEAIIYGDIQTSCEGVFHHTLTLWFENLSISCIIMTNEELLDTITRLAAKREYKLEIICDKDSPTQKLKELNNIYLLET